MLNIVEPKQTIFTDSGRVRVVPAVGECCGVLFELRSFTNTCEICGADYSKNGSRLAPRSCWGEETGEHWSECI